jgi:hypothetical protein
MLTSAQNAVPRVLWRRIELGTETKIRKAASFFCTNPAMGGLIHELHFGKDLGANGEQTWAGNASALVCLARNLRSLTLLVWNDGVVISASLHRADTLRHLTINIKTSGMMQSMLDSVDWINRLTNLEGLDVRTENRDHHFDTFDMTSIQIPVLRLPSLKILRLFIHTPYGLLLFFARAQLRKLHTVACFTIYRESDGTGVLEFFQAHQQVQFQLVGAEFLMDPQVVGSIKSDTLRITLTLAWLPLRFAELLSPSVRTLLLEDVDEHSASFALWTILDGLATSSNVCVVHVLSTLRDTPEESVKPFRWMVNAAQPLQDWEIMMHSRMVSYVPILAKRGIVLYDCDDHIFKDYL